MANVEGFKYWTDNEAVRGFDANAFLMSQSVMRFTSASDRDSALGRSLTAGMVAYDKSTSTLQLYDGTSWLDVAVGSVGVTDHGLLTGLADDDHPQYLTEARGDARYAAVDSSPTITLAGDASGSVTLTNLGNGTLTVAVNDDSHNHTIANVDNLQTTLDGKAASSHTHSYLSNNTNTYWTSGQFTFRSADVLESSSGDQATLEVYQDTAGADAFMQFHVSGDYAAYFGLKGDINDFAVGGWSMGGTYYRMWHAGNSNSYSIDWYQDASYADNWHRSTGTSGFYHESYGGGWYMTDSTWVRVYNAKHLYTNGGKFRAYRSANEGDWSNAIIGGDCGGGFSGLAVRCGNSDTHTGQFRPSSGAFYVRNHNDTAYWQINAYWYNPSSRTLKQDIETWGFAKPLSSAVNADYDTTVTDLLKRLRVVSYRFKKQNNLPANVSSKRRSDALDRLNAYRYKRGLDLYEGDEAVHQCGRDCDGSADAPCDEFRNWERGTIGLIAEEVAEVIPEATNVDLNPSSPTKGTDAGLDPMALIAITIKAFQELEARLSILESNNFIGA